MVAATSAPVAVVVTSPPTAAPVAAATPASVALATPGPTVAGTSPRDLDLTPSPTAEATTAESAGASSEGGVATASSAGDDYHSQSTDITAGNDYHSPSTDDVSAGNVSADDICFSVCLNDEDCAECITVAPESEDEYVQCLEEAGDSNCDFLVAGLCCMAALSGNDCMAMDAYNEFVSCYFETVVATAASSTCLIEDFECSAISGFGSDGNGAGAAAASSQFAAVLTGALGLAAVVAAGL